MRQRTAGRAGAARAPAAYGADPRTETSRWAASADPPKKRGTGRSCAFSHVHDDRAASKRTAADVLPTREQRTDMNPELGTLSDCHSPQSCSPTLQPGFYSRPPDAASTFSPKNPRFSASRERPPPEHARRLPRPRPSAPACRATAIVPGERGPAMIPQPARLRRPSRGPAALQPMGKVAPRDSAVICRSGGGCPTACRQAGGAQRRRKWVAQA